eukprot:CAMPEP_0117007500 /NCGR_PEP_ID=MMETSP0472-20121206/7360_1 /TAXON_ID=693140 ORGANISM="Tiarina fusus, Strain LIS" /NCGR_SAMPLE_ID=MMETSP0472 /ASSEMBLY_ACC=CAM_ASM_000603 /LENGTH=220 /DNA_ID=CAMNT_0004709291 /DNA_START=1619 /DNA_END=2278 /DNA_ORIENTATION=+
MLVDSKGHMKLTDFGLSKTGLNKQTQEFLDPTQEEKEVNTEVVGTPDYLAPEVLLGLGHSYPVDWWALGILLYEFLVGITPFTGQTVQEIFENIITGDIRWPEDPEDMPEDAKDLITKLLCADPSERLGANGADEVKQHPFFHDINWDSLLTDSVPPFVPDTVNLEDTSYFEAREEYWPLIEEDFGAVFTEKNSSSEAEEFEDFWCINVKNLKERNAEVL